MILDKDPSFDILQSLLAVLRRIPHLAELIRSLSLRIASIEFGEAVVRGEVFRSE